MIYLDHNATTDTGASRQMIRFSLGAENTREEIEAAIAAVRRAVAVLRA